MKTIINKIYRSTPGGSFMSVEKMEKKKTYSGRSSMFFEKFDIKEHATPLELRCFFFCFFYQHFAPAGAKRKPRTNC